MSDSPRRLLVTGAAGFIGSNLVLEAARAGWQVTGLDLRPDPGPARLRPWLPGTPPTEGTVRLERIDLLDRDALIETVRTVAPHGVVHLGARTDLDNTVGLDAYAANTTGVQNMMDAVRAAGVERVLWASSRLVFAIDHRPRSSDDYKPSTQYGVSKVAGELLVRGALADLPHSIIVRPTSIWGPGFGEPYHAFFRTVLAGRYVHPRGHRPRKSFGYVENTCYQLLSLLDRAPDLPTGSTFMLGDYEPLDLLAWAEYIARAAGAPRIRQVPMPALRAAAVLGDRLRSPRWPLTTFRLDNLVTDMQYDLSDLRAVAPDLPVSWQDGVRRTLRWMRHDT
jgi:nucleoside-diphosphate-sugar epimerase